MSPTSKLRRAVVPALALGALALGVPAALAAGGDSANAGAAAPAVERFVQDEQAPQNPGDCPERGGREGGGDATLAPESSATPDTSV